MWSRRLLNAFVLRPLAWLLIRVTVEGAKNVPPDAPFILMINHTNFLDAAAAVVALLPREVVLFTKAENLRTLGLGLLLTWYGAMPVERGEADVTAIRHALEVLLEDRHILLVAPEGTRSYHGRLLPAKNGMAFIATRAGVPVLPVGVTGVKGFQDNVRHFRRTQVKVRIGHPFRFRQQGRVRKETLEEMTQEAMYQLAALLPSEQWGAYSDLENATEEHLQFLEPGASNLIYACPRPSLSAAPLEQGSAAP
jgi:1-acyl-sn-glycerol-3-phosphate acyltransferase